MCDHQLQLLLAFVVLLIGSERRTRSYNPPLCIHSKKHSHCSTLAALPVCIILIFFLTFLIGQVVVLVQRQLEGQSGTYDILRNGKMSHSMTSHSPDLILVMVTYVAPKADRPCGLWPRSLVAVYDERISEHEPHFERKTLCIVFILKMQTCQRNCDFHLKSCGLSLSFVMRFKATWKSPVANHRNATPGIQLNLF